MSFYKLLKSSHCLELLQEFNNSREGLINPQKKEEELDFVFNMKIKSIWKNKK